MQKHCKTFTAFLTIFCTNFAASCYGEDSAREDKVHAILESYEKDLEKDPDNYRLIKALADGYFSIHDYHAAVIYYQRALELNPSNQQLKILLAKSYLNLGETKKSRDLFQEALKHDPDNQEILTSLKEIEERETPDRIAKLRKQIQESELEKDYTRAEILALQLIEEYPKDAHNYYLLGQLYLLMERPQEAISSYQKGLVISPDSSELQLALGSFFMQEKRYEEAEKIYEKLSTQYPQEKWIQDLLHASQENALVDKAKQFEEKGDLKQVEEVYAQLIKKFPQKGDNYFRLGQLYAHTKRTKEAIEQYEKGVAASPNATYIWLSLGYAYLEDKDLDKSEEAFEEVLKQDPKNGEALAGLGHVAKAQGNDAVAEKYYKKALKVDPESGSALSSMAELRMKQKRYAEAQKDYEKLAKLYPKEKWVEGALRNAKQAPIFEKIDKLEEQKDFATVEKEYLKLIKNSPDDADIYFRLGQFYMRRERPQDAVHAFAQAIQLNPKASYIHSAMGFALLDVKEYPQSKREFQIVVEQDPANAEAWAGIGRVEAAQGNEQEAEFVYQKALILEPNNGTALAGMGELRLKQKRYAEAEAYYEQLQKHYPNDTWIKNSIEAARDAPLLDRIEALEKKEQWAEAEHLYLELIQKEPHNADFYHRLGQIYVNLKQFDKAVDAYQEALTLKPEANYTRTALGITYLMRYESTAPSNAATTSYKLQDAAQYSFLFNDLMEAEKLLQEAVKREPKNSEALVGLGRIEVVKGHKERAEEYYLQAIASTEKNDTALSYLGELLLKEKRYLEAMEVYCELLMREPETLWIQNAYDNAKDGPYLDYARWLEDWNEYDDAKDVYLQILMSSPNNIDRYLALGQAYVSLEEYDYAIATYLKGLEIDPESAALMRALAYAYLYKNDLCRSIGIFLYLVDKDPNDAEAWAGLAHAEDLNDDPCAAEGHFAQALAINPNNGSALAFLSALRQRQLYNFSARNLYLRLLQVDPNAQWIWNGYDSTLNLTRPLLTGEGGYYEEDQWDNIVDAWVARYEVYGGRVWLGYPVNDCLTLTARYANEYFTLRDTFSHFNFYYFMVNRGYIGARYIINSRWYVDLRFGGSIFSKARESTFKNLAGSFIEPTVLFFFHTIRTRASLGYTTDSLTVARDFATNRAKMVGRDIVTTRFEHEFNQKILWGCEAFAFWYHDFVHNTSQLAYTWFQWSPPTFPNNVNFRYQIQYQRFDKTIPDYWSFRWQIIHQLQVQFNKNWTPRFATTFSYAHGWEYTKTRFNQIVVLAPPIPLPFFLDVRQYDAFYGQATYTYQQLQASVFGTYSRDTKRYTIWSATADIRWRF